MYVHAGTPPRLITPSDFSLPAAPEASPAASLFSSSGTVPALLTHDESSVVSPSTATLTSVSELVSQKLESEGSISDVSEPKDIAGEARESEGSFELPSHPQKALGEFQGQMSLGEETRPLSAGAVAMDTQQQQIELGEEEEEVEEEEEEEGEKVGEEEGEEESGVEVKKKKLSLSSHGSPEDSNLYEVQTEVLNLDNPNVPPAGQIEDTPGFAHEGYDEFTRSLLDPRKQGQLLMSTERSEFDTETSELVSVNSMEHVQVHPGDSEITKAIGPPQDYLELLRKTTSASEEKPSKEVRRDESPWPDIGGLNFTLSSPKPLGGSGELPTDAVQAKVNQMPALIPVEAHRTEPIGGKGMDLDGGRLTSDVSGAQVRSSEAAGLVKTETQTELEVEVEEEGEEEGEGEGEGGETGAQERENEEEDEEEEEEEEEEEDEIAG